MRSWFKRDGSVTYKKGDSVEIRDYGSGKWLSAEVLVKGTLYGETAYQVKLGEHNIRAVRLSDIRKVQNGTS